MTHVEQLDIGLDRDVFLRSLVRELAGSLEDVVGVEEASGHVSLVAQVVGDYSNERYTRAPAVERLDRQQVAAVLSVRFAAARGGGTADGRTAARDAAGRAPSRPASVPGLHPATELRPRRPGTSSAASRGRAARR